MFLPSQNTIWVNSSPTALSSSITPAPPMFWSKISLMYSIVSPKLWRCSPWTLTPLPPVSPTGLTTISWSIFFRYSSASFALSKDANPRFPSMPWSFTRFLMNDFEVSILAAALVGDAHDIPASSRASTIPTSKGASGPTNASSTEFSRANLRTLPTSFSSIRAYFFALLIIPGLAFFITAYISEPALWKASTAACSLPPPPTVRTRIFTAPFLRLSHQRPCPSSRCTS